MILDLSNRTQHRRGTWHSYDAPYERLRVFSPWTIGGFGLAVCLGLVLVYPYQKLEDRLAMNDAAGTTDRLTVEYLKVFLKAQPSAQQLRVSLVRQLINLGAFDEAREALAPLHAANEPALKLEAAWQELRILEQEAFADLAGTQSRAERVARVRILLLALIQLEQTDQNLMLLAKKALATEDQSIALAAYQRLAIQAHALSASQLAEGARFALGLGDYKTSSLLSLKAMQRTQRLDARRDHFLDAMRALQAVGLLDEAITVADANLGPLSQDLATLMFLTRLAQAANRPADAQRYAKRMLKMSHADQNERDGGWFAPRQTPMEYVLAQWLSEGPTRLRRVAGKAAPVNGEDVMLPFQEDAYQLAFDIFLANRNLEDARRLARAAVTQRPDLTIWRKRLAELSEWTGAPAPALEHWIAYARATNDEAGWDAVLRLSDGLGNLPTLQEALRYKVAREPGDDRWFYRLLSSHENSGSPEEALRLVRARLGAASSQGKPAARRQLIRFYFDLALRMGSARETDRALHLLEAEFGSERDTAHQLAVHLSSQGKLADALNALQRGAALVPPTDTEFWRTYADVAQLLQENDAARSVYLKMIGAGVQSDEDEQDLIGLLEANQPRAAALVAEHAFGRSGGDRLALRALLLHLRTSDWRGAQRLLDKLPPAVLATLERDVDFLSGRAAMHQSNGKMREARADYAAALALRPADSGLRAALLWSTIALRDTRELKRLLGAWASDAVSDSAMWGPFAAGHMALNQQDVALRWFRKPGFLANDYLWLMSYAECLEANAQPELAWRIRRKAWVDLRRPEVLQAMDASQWQAMRDRLAGLAPIFAEGDGARAIIAALLRSDVSDLRQDRSSASQSAPEDGRALVERIAQLSEVRIQDTDRTGVSGMFAPGTGARPLDDATLSASVREVALAYALNRNGHDLAQAWLAARFAQQLAVPLWAQLSLTLATDDRDGIRRLLDTASDWLPMYDRVEAAQRIGHPALAQTLAFDQLTRLPDDAELHRRMTSFVEPDTALFKPSLQVERSSLQQEPLDIERTGVRVTMRLTSGLALALSTTLRSQTSTNPAQLGAVSRRDDDVALALQAKTDGGHLALQVQQRHAATSTTGLRLDYRLSVAPGLDVGLAAAWRERATESAALRTAGMRDGVELAATYAIGNREYVNVGLAWQRYASQAGTSIGTGLRINAEAGTHLRIEYPNLTLRLFASQARYDANGRIDSQLAAIVPAAIDPLRFPFLPDGTRTVGLALGVGTVAENRYNRAWRPFGELGVLYDTTVGSSPMLRGGVTGSVFGQDTLTLHMQQTGGTSANPDGLRELGFHYQWLY